MSQFEACVQSTPAAQLVAPEQTTRQGTDGGHSTRWAQPSFASQRMTHSPPTHVPIPLPSHNRLQAASAPASPASAMGGFASTSASSVLAASGRFDSASGWGSAGCSGSTGTSVRSGNVFGSSTELSGAATTSATAASLAPTPSNSGDEEEPHALSMASNKSRRVHVPGMIMIARPLGAKISSGVVPMV